MEQQKKVRVDLALGQPLNHIKILIPLLEHRNLIAVHWMDSNEDDRKKIEEQIQYINDKIIHTLGLLKV